VDDKEDFINHLKSISGTVESKMFIGKEESILMLPENSIEGVDKVQKLIDSYLKEKGGKVDYIHGENDLKEISAKTDGIGILLKPMEKDALFDYIVKNGVLLRKTFSMGEANEIRYYIEC